MTVDETVAAVAERVAAQPPTAAEAEAAWTRVQLARHPQRPRTLDLVRRIFSDFTELHGDRAFRDDPAIVGGPALLDGRPVMVIGHQKGTDTERTSSATSDPPIRRAFARRSACSAWPTSSRCRSSRSSTPPARFPDPRPRSAARRRPSRRASS